MYKKLLLYLTLGFVGLVFLFACISFAPKATLPMQILSIIFIVLAIICLLLYLFYKPSNKTTAKSESQTA